MDKWFVRRYNRFFEEAKKRLPKDCHVIVIGANDGVQRDPTGQIWRDEWKGWFIEPNPIAQERMQKNIGNKNVTVVPFAVTSGEGHNVLNLWSMLPEASALFEKEKGDHGSCLTSFNKEHITSRIKLSLPSAYVKEHGGADKLVKQITVRAEPLYKIVEEFQIPRVDLIQIDTEGMDLIMVEQVCDCINREVFPMPSLILYEHRHLCETDRVKAEEVLRENKFITEKMHNDTIAFPNPKKTWML